MVERDGDEVGVGVEETVGAGAGAGKGIRLLRARPADALGCVGRLAPDMRGPARHRGARVGGLRRRRQRARGRRGRRAGRAPLRLISPPLIPRRTVHIGPALATACERRLRWSLAFDDHASSPSSSLHAFPGTARLIAPPPPHRACARELGRRHLRRRRLRRPHRPLQRRHQPASLVSLLLAILLSGSYPSRRLEEYGGIHPFVALHAHQRNMASRLLCPAQVLSHPRGPASRGPASSKRSQTLCKRRGWNCLYSRPRCVSLPSLEFSSLIRSKASRAALAFAATPRAPLLLLSINPSLGYIIWYVHCCLPRVIVGSYAVQHARAKCCLRRVICEQSPCLLFISSGLECVYGDAAGRTSNDVISIKRIAAHFALKELMTF